MCAHAHAGYARVHAVVGSFQRTHLQEAEDTSYYLRPTQLAFFSTLYFCFAGRRLLFFPACTDKRSYQQERREGLGTVLTHTACNRTKTPLQ